MAAMLRSSPSLGSRFAATDQHSSCVIALPRRLTGTHIQRNTLTAAAAAATGATSPITATAAVALATVAAASSSSVLGLSAALLFGASSALMVPVYGFMAFFRTARWTRFGLLHSPALYTALAVLHVAALVAAWPMGLGAALTTATQAVGSAVGGLTVNGISGVVAASTKALGALSGMFSVAPVTTLTAWLHLICLDVLMAREVALDGLTGGVATWHSVLLCFFFGPLGLLSHAVTRVLSGGRR